MGCGHPVRVDREWDRHRGCWAAAEAGMRRRNLLVVACSVGPIHKAVDFVQVRVQVRILDDGHLRRGSRDAVGQIGRVGRLVVVRRLFIYRGGGKEKKKRIRI